MSIIQSSSFFIQPIGLLGLSIGFMLCWFPLIYQRDSRTARWVSFYFVSGFFTPVHPNLPRTKKLQLQLRRGFVYFSSFTCSSSTQDHLVDQWPFCDILSAVACPPSCGYFTLIFLFPFSWHFFLGVCFVSSHASYFRLPISISDF